MCVNRGRPVIGCQNWEGNGPRGREHLPQCAGLGHLAGQVFTVLPEGLHFSSMEGPVLGNRGPR